MRQWRKDNPDKNKETATKSRNKPEVKVKALVQAKEYRDTNKEFISIKRSNKSKSLSPEYKYNFHLNKMYGITYVDYLHMYEAQEGRCLICNTYKEKLNVDHCHATGKIRGLLCFVCNLGLGHFKDREDLLHAAAEYLKCHRH